MSAVSWDEEPEVLGQTRIRGHCTFDWREPIDDTSRIIELRDHHCDRCIAELRRQPRGGRRLRLIDKRRKRS